MARDDNMVTLVNSLPGHCQCKKSFGENLEQRKSADFTTSRLGVVRALNYSISDK